MATWTVNELADVLSLEVFGVDAVITDHVAETLLAVGRTV
jgi:glycerophosphoryl diester phosphodiesterase